MERVKEGTLKLDWCVGWLGVVVALFLGGGAYANADRVSGLAYTRTFSALGQSSAETAVSQEAVESKVSQQAAVFLASLRTKYNLPQESAFTAPDASTVARHLCLWHQQNFQSMEIVGTSARICFRPDGDKEEEAATICDGECLRNPLPTTIDQDDAGNIAEIEMRKMLGNRFGTVTRKEVEPMWAEDPDGKGVTGIFKVTFVLKDPYGRFEAYLHGTHGDVLMYEDKIIYAEGRAEVYERKTWLERTPTLTPVVLPNLLTWERLVSPEVMILNEDGPSATNNSGDYVFDPRDTHFDEAQVYYATQVAMEKYKSWGYRPFGSLPIYVHYGKDYDNAFYDGEMIAIGDGDGVNLRDLAKDNTVITHEYGHAVIDHLAHIGFSVSSGDGPAIHEGMADYYACAVYDMPTLGEGAMPDGSPLRRCDTDLPFSTSRDEDEHMGGQVVSGAMWEIRSKIGAAMADQLSIAMLPRLDRSGARGSVRLTDIPGAVVAADRALFGGKNEGVLKAVFERRGFIKHRQQDKPWWWPF